MQGFIVTDRDDEENVNSAPPKVSKSQSLNVSTPQLSEVATDSCQEDYVCRTAYFLLVPSEQLVHVLREGFPGASPRHRVG